MCVSDVDSFSRCFLTVSWETPLPWDYEDKRKLIDTVFNQSRHSGGSFPILDFAAPLRFSRNLHVCSVVVHIWCLNLVSNSKPLVSHFRASVCTSRLYIFGCHHFVFLIVLLSCPEITSFFDFASFPLEACCLPFLSVFWYWFLFNQSINLEQQTRRAAVRAMARG